MFSSKHCFPTEFKLETDRFGILRQLETLRSELVSSEKREYSKHIIYKVFRTS